MDHKTRKKTARTLGALGVAVAAWLNSFKNKNQPAIEDAPKFMEEGDNDFIPGSVAETVGDAMEDAAGESVKAPANTFMDLVTGDTGQAIASAMKVLGALTTAGRVGFALWDIFSPQKRHEREVQAAKKSLADTAAFEYLDEVARFAKKIQRPSPENEQWKQIVNYRVGVLLKYLTYPDTSREFNEFGKYYMDEAMKDGDDAMATRLAITQASTISSVEAARQYYDRCDFEKFNTIGKIRLEAMQEVLIEAAKTRANLERVQYRGMKRTAEDIVGAMDQTRVASTNRRDVMEEEEEEDPFYDIASQRLAEIKVPGVLDAEDSDFYDRASERLAELKSPPRKRRKSSEEEHFSDPRFQELYDEVNGRDKRVNRRVRVKNPPLLADPAGTRYALRNAVDVGSKIETVGKQVEQANRARKAVGKVVKVAKTAKKVYDFKKKIGLGMINHRKDHLKKRSGKKKRLSKKTVKSTYEIYY